MTIRLTLKFVICFTALSLVMHEAHEIAHTSVARLICGCWGERDFNVWGICEGCFEQHPLVIISTFAGPAFTFILIWIGTALLKESNSNRQKSLGFSLIFANMPFARILTGAMGGGDEIWGLTKILHNHTLAWATGLIFILLVVSYPLYKAFKTINNKWRIGLFVLFFLTPVAIDFAVVLGLMNTLLSKGILATYWILGSPVLVTVWTIFVATVFITTRKYIYTLGDKKSEAVVYQYAGQPYPAIE